MTVEDLRKITEKWSKRDIGLENDILELYKARSWWENHMGKVSGQNKIDLEFNLEIVKKILDTSEEELKQKQWDYGILVNNGKLGLVRSLIGNPEKVAWNYFRKYAWEGDSAVTGLREVDLVKTIAKLINGDEVGYLCKDYVQGIDGIKNSGLFDECRMGGSSGGQNYKVKSVLKAVLPDLVGRRVPVKGNGGSWGEQTEAGKNWNKIYNEDFKLTKVINEKCERDYSWWEFGNLTDLEKKIRQREFY